jgi:transposase InsO family protein
MPRIIDVQPRWKTGPQVARYPGLLAFAGAILLICAPVFPGLSRLVVLPGLLLAPGYALLRLLGQAAGTRSISVAVPVSLVLAICASLVLNVSGIRLGPLSLGLLLGAVTALFLAGSYCRQLVAEPRRWPGHDRLPPSPAPPDHGARGHVQLLPEPARPGQPVGPQAAAAPPNMRVAAEQPNECWQSDFTHYVLADGAGAEILTWLDAHSRLALSVTARHAVTGPDMVASFRAAVDAYGPPASIQTGNGMASTSRFSANSGGRNGFEQELRRQGITLKSGKPSHPQTQVRIQRFQRTLKRWLRAQPVQPETVADLQALLDAFTTHYNQQRPHRSLGGATPATAYGGRPKATPGDRAGDTHDRVRAEYVGETGTVTVRFDGRLRHIGIGRKHAGTPVLLLVQNSRVRIIHARTGELLSELILNPQEQRQRTPPGDQEPR